MMQVFGSDGELIPVTVVDAKPCTVVDVRTRDRDGYDAVQLGFGQRSDKRKTKAVRGHMTKAGRSTFIGLVEFRVTDASAFQVGQEVKVSDVFASGDKIDVSGVTKGKGFQGVVRRYGFAGHTATHGTHESFRGPGSVGAGTYPGHIWKGKRMPGHMGSRKRTTQNLEVVEVRADDGLILVRGGVPGARGERVILKPAVKKAVR
jgi:large subunit ribosomal protein L3